MIFTSKELRLLLSALDMYLNAAKREEVPNYDSETGVLVSLKLLNMVLLPDLSYTLKKISLIQEKESTA